MSKGSKVIIVRIGDALDAAVRSAVQKRNDGPNQVRHWTVSEWVRQAIIDKLAHDKRSRCRSRKPVAPTLVPGTAGVEGIPF